MAILDLQDMKVTETTTQFGSNKSNNRCTGGKGGGGGSRLSLLLC